jgi:S-adenosylmethionine:tRNA ribosyltransferase-isomerase
VPETSLRTLDFDYSLPPELIAQHPAPQRDQSRLLVLDRSTGQTTHHRFPDLLSHLRLGDTLILNNSRVIPARLRGVKRGSGGQIEILLVEEVAKNDWWALLRPGKRVRPGSMIDFTNHDGSPAPLSAELLEKNEAGHCRLRFQCAGDVLDLIDALGEIPLPPYIDRAAGPSSAEDLERYQTVYAAPRGSVAAPTAGLHFTPELLQQIKDRGINIHYVTLHVGLGTFAPLKVDRIAEHQMHSERFEISAETVAAIAKTKAEGGRVFAIGTTTVRVLESAAAQNDGQLAPMRGTTSIFIFPPYRFQVVDGLVTNFHLPQSTLLMLVSAFAAPGEMRGREMMLATYAEAVREKYRFFSYGDAMLIS